jgi:hypothetical protein
MDLIGFLSTLVADSFLGVATVAITVGALIFGLIEGIDAIVKHSNPAGLSSRFKFYMAIVLAFIVPVGAYVALQLQTSQPVVLNGLFLACAVGYVVSQGLHRLWEGKPEKEAPGGTT